MGRHRRRGRRAPLVALSAAIALAACAAWSCGRIGYPRASRAPDGGSSEDSGSSGDGGPAEDGGAPSPRAATFYISPDGNDAAPGSRAEPWRTWSHALGQLLPGDTLIALDGRYGARSLTGYPSIDCRSESRTCGDQPCRNGTRDAPITVRAENERRAQISGDGSSRPLLVLGCSYWTLEGLRAEDGDYIGEVGPGPGAAVAVGDSAHVTLRRFLLARSNRYFNANLLQIGRSSDVLVEECELYSFHRHGLAVHESTGVTIRRNFVSSRLAADIPGGFQSFCSAEGDTGILLFATRASIVENNIVEGTCGGFGVLADETSLVETGAPDDNHLLGNIALNALAGGFYVRSECNFQGPCTVGDRIVERTIFRDDVAFNAAEGFLFISGKENRVENVTAIANADAGLTFTSTAPSAGVAATSFASHALVVGPSAYGFTVNGQAAWSIEYANAFGVARPYSPLDTNVTSSTQIDPDLGECLVYIPRGSTMKGAGRNGGDIGANVVFRYQDGVLTAAKLWDPVSGQFPCGAAIPGLNDDPDGATPEKVGCRNVHKTLRVGAPGCPVP